MRLHHVQVSGPAGGEDAPRRFHAADPHGNRVEVLAGLVPPP